MLVIFSRGPGDESCAGSRTLTWLPLLVMARWLAVLSSDDHGWSVERRCACYPGSWWACRPGGVSSRWLVGLGLFAQVGWDMTTATARLSGGAGDGADCCCAWRRAAAEGAAHRQGCLGARDRDGLALAGAAVPAVEDLVAAFIGLAR